MSRKQVLPQVREDVPASLMELAWQRTGNFLKHMWICKYDLQSVVISAYLQGVDDALETLKAGE